jgi:hypothetical protein
MRISFLTEAIVTGVQKTEHRVKRRQYDCKSEDVQCLAGHADPRTTRLYYAPLTIMLSSRRIQV